MSGKCHNTNLEQLTPWILLLGSNEGYFDLSFQFTAVFVIQQILIQGWIIVTDPLASKTSGTFNIQTTTILTRLVLGLFSVLWLLQGWVLQQIGQLTPHLYQLYQHLCLVIWAHISPTVPYNMPEIKTEMCLKTCIYSKRLQCHFL